MIKKLIAYLGSESNYSSDSHYCSGNVVEHCEWIFDNCVIGVSMYGGVREEDDERIIGCLSISLSDVELLDSLYSKPIRDVEYKMADEVDISTIQSFRHSKHRVCDGQGKEKSFRTILRLSLSEHLMGCTKTYFFKPHYLLAQS